MLFVLVFAFGFVSASVEVHNHSVNDSYSPFEIIAGEINLTIVGEEYDELIISNDDDEISLGDFLNASGNLFECSPPDCSKDYSSSAGVVDKSFSVPASGNIYLGFVVTGEDVVVEDLDFKFESDFGVSSRVPLDINFFEEEDWKFGEFSNEFLEKDYGCYDVTAGSVGPLIGNVRYCEMIRFPDSGAMKVGAIVSGSDALDLDMTVYPDTGTGGSWPCSYDPGTEDGCVVFPNVGEIFSSGDYQVCVNAKASTKYRIYNESEGSNCGFVYTSGSDNSTKDYSVFAQGVKYADASLLESADFGNEDIIIAANKLIEERYEGDCSDGCILPISISGVSQNARIYDVSLSFTKNLELDSTDKIYDLDVVPVLVDFDGVVDLSSLGFSVSETMDYVVSLGSEELFDVSVDILPAPIISSVFPLNPPAGVPIRFYVNVDYPDNVSLIYEWDFGDGVTEMTSIPYAMHTYAELKNYNLNVEVSAGGDLTSNKDFVVDVISPEVAVNESLVSRRNALDNVISQLAKFPSWYGGPLGKLIDVLSFEAELDRLDRAYVNSFIDSDFVDVAKDLYALDVPVVVAVESFDFPYLIADAEDVDIEPVEIISGAVSGSVSEDYANPILTWQNENVDGGLVSKMFSVLSYSGELGGIFRTYSFDVNLKYDSEAYFVINKPFSELYFKEGVGARKAGDATVIILAAGSDTSFEFYYEGSEPVSFFVSPKLSSIVVEANIDTTCNYNLVCEKENGENPDTCRSDCKPIVKAIIYLVLAFLFVFVLYSVLQIWYKRRYEGHLFKDRRQSYNLLMYVTNARARGMNDDRIAAELRKNGWSTERVNYIIKKSVGKRTGLYEIIPFEKVFAYFRNRKARKVQAAKVGVSRGARY